MSWLSLLIRLLQILNNAIGCLGRIRTPILVVLLKDDVSQAFVSNAVSSVFVAWF